MASKDGSCCLQLTGALLVPFVVEMETLFLTALFRPLDEQLFISQLAVIQVQSELVPLHCHLMMAVQCIARALLPRPAGLSMLMHVCLWQ